MVPDVERHSLLCGLRVAHSVFDRLVAAELISLHAPAVVEAAEGDVGAVSRAAVVQGGADFVERRPVPKEVDIRKISGFADSGDRHQLTARDVKSDCTARWPGNKRLEYIDTCR